MVGQLISATEQGFKGRDGEQVEYVDLVLKAGDLGVVNATCSKQVFAGLNGGRQRLDADEIVKVHVDLQCQPDRGNPKRYAFKVKDLAEADKTSSAPTAPAPAKQ